MHNRGILDIALTQPLVLLVTLIGGGALVAGTFSLVAPSSALQVYGISTSQDASKKRSGSPTSADYEPIARSLSIRNVTLGLSILALTAYWQRLADEDVLAGHSIQICLGYIIMIGSIVPAIDAYGAYTDGSEALRNPVTILHCFRFCAWFFGGIWCLTT